MNWSCQRRVRRSFLTLTTCWASSWWFSLTRASTEMDSSSLASKLAQPTLTSPPRYLLKRIFGCLVHEPLNLYLLAGQVWNKGLPSQHRPRGQRLSQHIEGRLEASAHNQLDSVRSSIPISGEFRGLEEYWVIITFKFYRSQILKTH